MTFCRSAWTELREGGLFHSERSSTMSFFHNFTSHFSAKLLLPSLILIPLILGSIKNYLSVISVTYLLVNL